MRWFKARKWGWWLVLWLVGTGLTLGWINITVAYHHYCDIPTAHLIGNTPDTVNALNPDGHRGPFSFLVISDSHNKETSEALMALALKTNNPAFMIIDGDVVDHPDIWAHHMFLTEMTTELRPPFPVFLVPGNHDIAYTNHDPTVKKERQVTPEVYDQLYGARNFHFTYHNCLFILLESTNTVTPTAYLGYLANVLAEGAAGKSAIFVFTHFPPAGLADYITPSLPAEETFFRLMETYKVTTCFFGHYHSYWRGQRNGVNIVLLGGGGGRLRPQPVGNFHQMMRVTVDRDKIGEELIVSPEKSNWEEWLEERAFTVVFPILGQADWLLYVILIFLAAGWIFTTLNLYVGLRNRFVLRQ